MDSKTIPKSGDNHPHRSEQDVEGLIVSLNNIWIGSFKLRLLSMLFEEGMEKLADKQSNSDDEEDKGDNDDAEDKAKVSYTYCILIIY
ncbi:hypothetical protein PTKIN_Ptkin04bG0077500 [Pterospermum kingtungense]